ncbi:MAG TPA: heterodisulfide reductase-related iron-sulfur binding cluster, partial [Fimbriimonadaceae bacterium]|nr:heterodisulfide reductase-related iron-sulfur binding cluster [Fimbriimonadaceae bacterium]
MVTGEETESPRGRIYLARSAEEQGLDWIEGVKPHLDRCLGCRACETACPSGVRYGELLELAREEIEMRAPHRAKHALLSGMTSPALMKVQLLLGKLYPGRRIPKFLSRMLSGQAPEADMPRAQSSGIYAPLQESELPAVRGHVLLLEGCVMRVLFPGVHEATRRLLRRVGFEVAEVDLGCCGALHAHAGYHSQGLERAHKLFERAKGLPIIVNSAGCGSFLKDFLLSHEAPPALKAVGPAAAVDETNLASAASERGDSATAVVRSQPLESEAPKVWDISEFLLGQGLADALASTAGLKHRVTYHDACHLAHGQGVRKEPRKLLEAIPLLELVELGESDRCCGSAGIYNLTQPGLARELLDRKWGFVQESGAEIVVSGNPGCHAWIE